MKEKIIIYQVFTRLFGNDRTDCKRNGSKEENGCGHFADFNKKALDEIRALGATHIWYTGVIAHATQTDYSAWGIHPDHPAIVKGRAGSPYAIKDYYDVDPDLSTVPEKRFIEFRNLLKRSHASGLKVIIDFVPNHVARGYKSTCKPEGVRDLGEDDNTGHAFNPQNNFYYIPDCTFMPDIDLQAGTTIPYYEHPAKATGNDNFSPYPGKNDWYETVKLNYGIDYCGGGARHFDPIPSTWMKMRDILLFWAGQGIDGFRCDMAEMVPAEFWGWVIPQVKQKYPRIIFIAEVYNPGEYRNYIHQGRFDYLYDKVGLYDTLRAVTCGHAPARQITSCWQSVDDIKGHMLNFLENHDEQRLASDFFAGDATKGRPALLVSACMGTNPMMVYFGQELGERGMDEEGFSGRDGRTTIFDYWSVDTIRRWRNKGKFGDTLLTEEEKSLKAFYTKVLELCNKEKSLREGDFYDLMYVNETGCFDSDRLYTFVRRKDNELTLIIANFDEEELHAEVCLPEHLFDFFQIKGKKKATATDLLTGDKESITFNAEQKVHTDVPAYGGKILKIRC